MNVCVLGQGMQPHWVRNKENNFAEEMINMLHGQFLVFQPQNLVVISITRSKSMFLTIC